MKNEKECPPAFESAMEETLMRSIEIGRERGGQYADTWALKNQVTRFLDMVLETVGTDRSREAKRLILAAALCDVKISRTLGGFKEDTLDDLINYLAALRAWLAEY